MVPLNRLEVRGRREGVGYSNSSVGKSRLSSLISYIAVFILFSTNLLIDSDMFSQLLTKLKMLIFYPTRIREVSCQHLLAKVVQAKVLRTTNTRAQINMCFIPLNPKLHIVMPF